MTRLSRCIFAVVLFALCTSCTKMENSDDLGPLVGKSIRGGEIQKWLNTLGREYEIKRYGNIFFYSFKNKGLSLRFDEREILSAIFLYSEGADDFRQYQGQVPFGLSFTDSRERIEETLGAPEKTGSRPDGRLQADYPTKGVGITYTGMGAEAKIHIIVLAAAEVGDHSE